MATIKSYTDIEQSKKLAEILPIESANMYYKYVLPKSDKIHYIPEIGNPVNSLKWYNEGYTFRGKKEPITLNEFCIPCWSLVALLNILDFPALTQEDENEWEVCVRDYNNDEYIEIKADNPIDACVDMILKLYEQKLL
jgi:hypothetical protein